MADNAFIEIMMAVIIILGIFGMLYILSSPFIGITLILVCGLLIFLRAFIQKNMG